MSEGIARNKDVLAGALFFTFGALAFTISLKYQLGVLLDMGPGYFPRILGGLLMVLGGLILVRGLRSKGGSAATWSFGPLAILTLAMVVFGLLIERVGLIPSLCVLIFGSAAAGRQFVFKEVAILTVLMCIFCYVVFIWGLKMNYPLLAWGW